MSDTPTPDAKPTAKHKPRRSWWWKWTRRILIGLVLFGVLSTVVLFIARTYVRSEGTRALAAEQARLDAEDSGWRWNDLQTAREKAAPPEAENSAVVVRRVRDLIPKEWNDWVNRPDQPENPDPPPLNRHIPLEELARDQELADATQKARDLGLTLRNYPRGYHVVVVEQNSPFIESLDETQKTRRVAHLMKIDAVFAAQDGDAVRGLRAAHAILNTARSIGDEPTLISSLVRYACRSIAIESTMRVLALTDSKAAGAELAVLQSALYAEVDEPVLLNGLRGELALFNRYFDALNDGTIAPDQMFKMGETKPSLEGRASFYFRRSFLPEDQRRYLQRMSELINAAKGPPHEQIATVKRVEDELRANRSSWYFFHQLALPATVKVMEASLRNRAELLSAATLIACERFRLARGRWPESLAELPKDLLPAIPIDPFTGEPMKFARLEDGITVCALPPKGLLNTNMKRLTNPLGGAEYGWRLYNPQLRGLPPLPKEKPDVPDMPDGPP